MNLEVHSKKTTLFNTLFTKKWNANDTLKVYCAGEQPKTVLLSDLQGMVENVATWLISQGVKQGNRLGIVSTNRLEYVLLDLAALRLGLVTAGFDPASFAKQQDLADSYSLDLLFYDKKFAETQASAKQARVIDTVLEAALTPQDISLPIPIEYDEKDVCTIKFTSGSTGAAKGLGATVGSVGQSLSSTQKMFSHGPGDTLLVFLPLSLLQQRYWIYSAIHYEHDVVLADSRLALEAIQQEHPTVIMGVPAFFDALKEFIEMMAGGDGHPEALVNAAKQVLGENIRYLWTGSAAARPDTLEFFERTCGVAIYEGYGLNETCITTKNHPEAHKRGSVGKPLDGVRVEIGSDGGIYVYRDHPVNDHYMYAAEGVSEKVFMSDGAVATGDLGHIDEDGFLYVMGRADDVVVLTNGKTIAVRPLEERILQLPDVKQTIVIGTGRHLLAALVSTAPDNDREDVKRDVLNATRGVGSEAVELVIFADDGFSMENGLLTSQGKVRRRAIQEYYNEVIQKGYGGQS